jgi:3-mercaptopyruvate sulfurtransferase SseA
MRKAGVQNVRALIGGYDKWVSSGGKVSTGEKP